MLAMCHADHAERGDQHGTNEYEAALADPNISPSAKELTDLDLLPPLFDHLMVLTGRRECLA
jgi:hypothetical protein